MKNIIKNDLLRLMQMKHNVILLIIITICSMFIGMYMSNQPQTIGRVAVLAADQDILQNNEQVSVTYVTHALPKSQLVMQKYDAYVYRDKQGTIKVDTVKGNDFKNALEAVIQHGTMRQQQTEARGRGTKIISFSMMFLMMQATIYMALFGEDKEHNVISRIMISSMTFTSYLMSQILFVMLCSFLPIFLTISIVSMCGLPIGFSLLTYAGLFLLLSLFSTMLTLFMNCIIHSQDTANMASSALIILTTILSGSFITTQSNRSLIGAISSFLPQKAYLSITQALEHGVFSQSNMYQLAYILTIVFILFSVSVYIMKNKNHV